VIHLPKDFRLEGSEVSIRREGRSLVVDPSPKPRMTREEVHETFRRMDAIGAGPSVPGERNQGEMKPRNIFD